MQPGQFPSHFPFPQHSESYVRFSKTNYSLNLTKFVVRYQLRRRRHSMALSPRPRATKCLNTLYIWHPLQKLTLLN